MSNRIKSSMNNNNNNTHNSQRTQNDDDNCSIICFKDLNDGHVGVVRIRQNIVCSICNLFRGTLSSYSKHILENNHRENVKKLCDEKRFLPTTYDQACNLAYYNNLTYQSDKFHFRYQHVNEDSDQSLNRTELATSKMGANTKKQKPVRKRRNLKITLVFQEKSYSKVGPATGEIREQLLKEMITDRADDISSLSIETYYTKKNKSSDNTHHNAQKSCVNLLMAKDQGQLMLTVPQHHQEPFENGDKSSSEINRKDNGAENNLAMCTDDISTVEKLDVDDQPSYVDNDINDCKDLLDHIISDIYLKCDELKREQQFLSGISRRNFKKRNTFFCDLCSTFLTSEKYCLQHLNGPEHLDKIRSYQTTFLPWRQAMQKSLIMGKSLRDTMGTRSYDDYKIKMALYLAPNCLSNRGRFCCAYCELIFTDQWTLEKHLHSLEHKTKETSTDHKELVVTFANCIILPNVFKLNGIKQLSEIPDDIKSRNQWRSVTRAQLDDDTNSFLRNYPLDQFEGVTRILNAKSSRKPKSSIKNSKNNFIATRNQQIRGTGFNRGRGGGGQQQAQNPYRNKAIKRTSQPPARPNKRFRGDLNNSFPGANPNAASRNYQNDQHDYLNRAPFYNNGNNNEPLNYLNSQQRQDFPNRTNFNSRSFPIENKGYYNDNNNHNRSLNPLPLKPNYDHERHQQVNPGNRGYDNHQSNYDSQFTHSTMKAAPDYYSGSISTGECDPSNRFYHRSYSNPTNEFNQHLSNSFQRVQQQHSSIRTVPHQNQNMLGGFQPNYNSMTKNNHNYPNSNVFSTHSVNQPSNHLRMNAPPVNSYDDYRTSTGLPTGNTHSSIYSSLADAKSVSFSQPRTFEQYSLSSIPHNSSNSYGRRNEGSYFANNESYNNDNNNNNNNTVHQNSIEQTNQSSWYGTSRDGGNLRGRGASGPNFFHSTNKQPGATFSYSSSNSINNQSLLMRGRDRNFRGHY